MQLRLFGIIFWKQINLIQILPRNHPTLTFLGILSSLRVADQENEDNTTTTRGAAVLISDGGHNRENSP